MGCSNYTAVPGGPSLRGGVMMKMMKKWYFPRKLSRIQCTYYPKARLNTVIYNEYKIKFTQSRLSQKSNTRFLNVTRHGLTRSYICHLNQDTCESKADADNIVFQINIDSNAEGTVWIMVMAGKGYVISSDLTFTNTVVTVRRFLLLIVGLIWVKLPSVFISLLARSEDISTSGRL